MTDVLVKAWKCGCSFNKGKIIRLLIILIGFVTICCIHNFSTNRSIFQDSKLQLKLQLPKKFSSPIRKSTTRPFVILMWTLHYGGDIRRLSYWVWPHIQHALKTCSVKCNIVFNRKWFHRSDAVIFYARDMNISDLPPHHPSHQPWIYYHLESPTYTRGGREKLRSFDRVFNWTMTYRLDSDIPHPYFYVLPDANESIKKPRDLNKLLSTKRKLVAWAVSNCNASSERHKYAAQLAAHIPVDIYGQCGKYKCPRENEDCFPQIGRQYKFYLAFENSVCQDYITEKFSNALLHQMVPIVYGGGEYARVALPHSYINVKDFKRPGDLAQYLLKLDKNPNLYLEYFQWKLKYRVEEFGKAFCELCTKIKQVRKRDKGWEHMQKSYTGEELQSWWFGKNSNSPICLTPLPD